MSIRALKYFLVLTIPILAYLSFSMKGIMTFAPFIEAFIIIPFLELFLVPSEKNLSSAQEEMTKDDWIYDLLLYLCLPTLYFLLWTFLGSMSQPNLTTFDKVGRILSMGLLCGSFGINIGHELGHRNKNYEQFFAKLLLLTSLYLHFFIEHNRGHHKNVSTTERYARLNIHRLEQDFPRLVERVKKRVLDTIQGDTKATIPINPPLIN